MINATYLRQALPVCALLTLTVPPALAQAPPAGTTLPAPIFTQYLGKQPAPKPNRVHVLIFWAPDTPAWAGVVPHLSLLNDDFASHADFTGVAVTKDAAAARAIVSQMGEALHFPQALTTDAVTRSFLGQTVPPLPLAVVLDKTGKVAWVGQPYDGLDDAIRATISGKLEPEQEALRQEQVRALTAEAAKAEQQAGDSAKSLTAKLAEIDRVLAKAEPFWQGGPVLYTPIYRLHMARYRLLLAEDPTRALPYLQQLTPKYYSDNAFVLNDMAWFVVHSPQASPELLRWAKDTAQQACEIHGYQWAKHIDTLAFAAWRNGDRDHAILWQKQAADTARRDERLPFAAQQEITEGIAPYLDPNNTPGALLPQPE